MNNLNFTSTTFVNNIMNKNYMKYPFKVKTIKKISNHFSLKIHYTNYSHLFIFNNDLHFSNKSNLKYLFYAISFRVFNVIINENLHMHEILYLVLKNLMRHYYYTLAL